jgi:hypothetical protein
MRCIVMGANIVKTPVTEAGDLARADASGHLQVTLALETQGGRNVFTHALTTQDKQRVPASKTGGRSQQAKHGAQSVRFHTKPRHKCIMHKSFIC